MRAIDFHTHPWRPAELAPATRDFIRSISPAVREHGDALQDVALAVRLLREQGLEHAVLLPEHCPATSGSVRTETVLELCARADGFFLPFASVDPNTDPAPVALLRSYLEAGARGLKLYPSYQYFYPNEPRLYPIYELCAHHGVPVLLHIGSSVIPGTRLKYCDPIHLDDVAVDFPSLALVLAHGGRGYWYDACSFLARHHPNVYIDIAGLVPERLPRHFPELERLAPRLVFGSDWPAMPRSVAANLATVEGLGLSDAALRLVLRDNAARLLRLEETSMQASAGTGG
ncbi:MAG TPA: amidohydrolase family protein [Longimicrobiales bacterium]|nr:amidohydrolase family protein [Longimicrobiales bacterium]